MGLNSSDIAGMRVDYTLRSFDIVDLKHNPFDQFELWMHEAIQAQVNEPNAMTLATVKPDGTPAARIVLLKGLDTEGFTFFTNYHSSKGIEIGHCPNVALVFCWLELQRQVRIEGIATKIASADSDAYFHSRPLGSRLGAHASPQSSVVASREELEKRYSDVEELFREKPIMRPDNWGGYCVNPARIEFWQGRSNRMHDRFLYSRQEGRWKAERLAP